MLHHSKRPNKLGDVIETSPQSLKLIDEMAQRISKHSDGLALVIDYGTLGRSTNPTLRVCLQFQLI